ncbi:hypothetical protein [Haladaptatus sp. CMAA 1911]|uniref:hypothetical protein n=1 Tax=unclassified Haladaptatus TaxID=2622732 RepID=UPI0037548CC0
MELVWDSYFDATFYAEHDPYREFDVSNAIDLMEADGTKVQIKGCLEWTKTATGRRRGRYRLWLPDHVQLVEDDAVYLFVVYDPTLPNPIQKTRFVRACDLERVAGCSIGGHRVGV